jgi:phosphotriesterase-related protein
MLDAIVQTIYGPVPAKEIGYTDAHSHLWIDAVSGADPAAPRLDDENLILRGLEEYAESGGEAIVDCQPPGCGRNAGKLQRISSKSGIKLIACTGFHRQRYYGPDYHLWRMGASEAYDFFTSETRNGLLETRDTESPVLPGFIKIAAEQTLDDSPQALFEAAAAACVSSGLAIEMHTERGADIERFLTFFDAQGVPIERLIFCHVDKRPDFGLHREMAQAGVMLEYDTFFRPKYEPEQHVWPLLLQMIAAGLSASIALATDMAEDAMWRDPGPAAFVRTIGRRLDEEGVDNAQKRGLLGGNITGRLAVRTNREQLDPEDISKGAP